VLFRYSRVFWIRPDVFNSSQKGVILSEAPRRSTHIRESMARSRRTPAVLFGQMLFGAFRPRTTREVKKSQPLSGAPHRFICDTALGCAEPKDPEDVYRPMSLGAFQPPQAPVRQAQGVLCGDPSTNPFQYQLAAAVQFRTDNVSYGQDLPVSRS
jgi:hypothetical protein